MADSPAKGSDLGRLDALEDLGAGADYAGAIFGLVGRSQFFTEFTRADTDLLASYMHIYRAKPQQTIIHEGDTGDYMLMIIDGEVDIYKTNLLGGQQYMTSVKPGATLGEMSMIDGAPRFATCVALRTTTFGVLTRDDMGRIIHDRPGLGAKILIKLVTLLSQRLRQTSAQLLHFLK
jgi:CRP/FNR family transcriptional regulator, cyclic AMP receptor protein